MVKIILFICIVVIEFLATTTLKIEIVESFWDKGNHFIAFFVLYVLLYFSYRKLQLTQRVLLLLVFGIQIEIVQHFIEGRYFSLLDVLADSVGILIGVVVCRIACSLQKQ